MDEQEKPKKENKQETKTSPMTIIDRITIFKKYAKYLKQIDFQIDPFLWILLSFLAATFASIIVFLLLPDFFQLGIILFIVILDLMVGYPYLKANQRIDEIEENIPDALKQMADTLRAGGTYEYALREIAASEYGPLKTELNEVLIKLEEGENFENSFKTLAENVDSILIKRTVTIIIDSVRSGAGLADILDEISEDVREAHRIGKERKTKTILQVLFMIAAGSAIAPMIFGFVSTISAVLINAAAAIATETEQTVARKASDIIQLSIQIYLIIEVMVSSAMISLMRDGKLTKTIIYLPILLFVAYFSYTIAKIVSGILVSGVA